jgi:uncharacterized protein YeeX (DUF496 family)
MTKTAMTIFLEFLEKCRDEKKEFDYDILIAFATELRDTAEKFELIKANVGHYSPEISNEDLQRLVNRGKQYYEDQYGDKTQKTNL